MFSPHLLARILLLGSILIYLSNATALGQTQSFELDPGFPPKRAVRDLLTVTVKVTPVSGATLPSIDNIRLVRLKLKTSTAIPDDALITSATPVRSLSTDKSSPRNVLS